MPLPETRRAALLRGLASAVGAHPDTPEPLGLQAVRLLRLAGATWHDVLEPELPGEPRDDDTEFLARHALHLLRFATPAQLARVAVLLRGELPPYGFRKMHLSHASMILGDVQLAQQAEARPPRFGSSAGFPHTLRGDA